MIISGILGIIFSLWVIIFPVEGALSLGWLIGIYSVIFGIFLVILACYLRSKQPEA
jgi:uncharacterized membrane protein HdeD (DUF308 family)